MRKIKKEFEKWNLEKIKTNSRDTNRSFHEREVWFIKIGKNIGFEQNGKGDQFLRPVIVYKKFSKNVFLGIPLTSIKKDGRFYFSFEFKNKIGSAILSQIRLFDTKRLSYLIGRMSKKDFGGVKEKLIELLQ
ncbi:MAG: type II toxin-antitoxin system PemK/MazF family toxin [Candidatus Pacebacteria bacterium]|nr:type II toxin-antitoxin system PemK/MazF family toxin [Candidatus Paceibacterota bacterium]